MVPNFTGRGFFRPHQPDQWAKSSRDTLREATDSTNYRPIFENRQNRTTSSLLVISIFSLLSI